MAARLGDLPDIVRLTAGALAQMNDIAAGLEFQPDRMAADLPTAHLTNVSLHYEWSGPQDAPIVVFSNSLGTNLSFWDAQVEALAPTYRILLYDTRGHGQSAAPPAPYTLAALGEDLLALLDNLQIHRAAVCGISLGGATALWLAAHAPARITAIVAANTSARIGSAEGWTGRIAQVERAGVSSLYPATLERWFTPSFLAQHPELPAMVEQTLATVSQTGYIGCCADSATPISTTNSPRSPSPP